MDQIKTMAYTLFEKLSPLATQLWSCLKLLLHTATSCTWFTVWMESIFPRPPVIKTRLVFSFIRRFGQHGKHPAAYAAHLQKLRAQCKRLGYTISLSEFLVQVRTGPEKPYLHLTNTFSLLESIDQPAYNHTSEDVLTMDKYAKWISLVTKEFQKLYPDVTHKTTATHGAVRSALSVRANVDQDKLAGYC